ncbi:MAG TPA: GxxExxY protein [Chitinophagaceae bacterium]|nr:GxxExxY protein [Chitinophagaceae bacterium]
MQNLDAINEITGKIIGASFKVHSELGPGLLESSYKECLAYVLSKEGLWVEKEKPLPLVYQEVRLEVGYRLDLFVENAVVVEIKAVDALADVHIAQVLTYLKLTQCKVGLLINFNVADLKKGIKRLIL